MAEGNMIPNGSYFYNLDTRRIHAGNFVDGILTPPAGEEKSKHTFNLVSKEYPSSARPLLEPTKFLDVLRFPTTMTTIHLLSLVWAAIEGKPWKVTMAAGSRTTNPTSPSEAPYFLVTTDEGMEALLEAREIAYDVVEHSDQWAIDDIKLTLNAQGLSV